MNWRLHNKKIVIIVIIAMIAAIMAAIGAYIYYIEGVHDIATIIFGTIVASICGAGMVYMTAIILCSAFAILGAIGSYLLLILSKIIKPIKKGIYNAKNKTKTTKIVKTENMEQQSEQPQQEPKKKRLSSYNIKWIAAYILYVIILLVGDIPLSYDKEESVIDSEGATFYLLLPALAYLLLPLLLKLIGNWKLIKWVDRTIDTIYNSIKSHK